MSIDFSKSGLLAAFLLITGLLAPHFVHAQISHYLDQAKSLQLHTNPVWLALIHSDGKTPSVRDRTFLLSANNFSPEAEVAATITELLTHDSAVCRFPARYEWLKKSLQLPQLELDACPEVSEFLENAPTEKISLVFASESLSQPASMMGHSFLKLSGSTRSGEWREHAISFFTEANTYNLPKLFIESLVTGKKGFFALSPYKQEIAHYVGLEQRSLWEFDLNLSEQQIRLLQLHLLELKHSDLTYFFHQYNCATVLRYITALSGNIEPNTELWVTPKDVIKAASQANLISDKRLITPSRWMIRALAEHIDETTKNKIVTYVHTGQADHIIKQTGEQAFLEFQYASAYNEYAFSKGELSSESHLKNSVALRSHLLDFDDYSLQEADSLNPVLTPNDSQVSLSWQATGHSKGLRLIFLPISHQLSDDNRNYPAETQLVLMSPTIKALPEKHSVQLESFTVYDMQSLIPYDPIAGGVSGKFSVIFGPVLDASLVEHRGFKTSGAIGRTLRIHRDIDIYGLGGAGIQLLAGEWQPLGSIEIGVILRGIWDTKSVLAHQTVKNFSSDLSPRSLTEWGFKQVKFFGREYSASVGLRFRQNQTHDDLAFEIGVKKIF